MVILKALLVLLLIQQINGVVPKHAFQLLILLLRINFYYSFIIDYTSDSCVFAYLVITSPIITTHVHLLFIHSCLILLCCMFFIAVANVMLDKLTSRQCVLLFYLSHLKFYRNEDKVIYNLQSYAIFPYFYWNCYLYICYI